MNDGKIIIEPCPVCGGRAGVYLRYDVPPLWSVACTKCGIEPPLPFGSYEYAVKQWNRRAFLGLWAKRPKEDGGAHIILEEEARDEYGRLGRNPGDQYSGVDLPVRNSVDHGDQGGQREIRRNEMTEENRKQLQKDDTPLTAEEQPRKYQQERRALKFAMAGSDGEDVKIPYSIACMLLKDLDALNAIRLTIQKL